MLRLSLCLIATLLTAACGGSSKGGPAPSGPAGDDPLGPLQGADVRLNTDLPGAALSVVPQLCVDGSRVYVVWYDRRNGAMDVYFNRSLDGGRTWLLRDVRLDTDLPGSHHSFVPRMCCAGDAVYVVWYDDRNGLPDVYFNRSLDAGRTWLSDDVRLDTDLVGTGGSREPVIGCKGGEVYVAWYDDRDGDWDVRFNRSVDAGTTWLADDVRIDRGPATTNARLPEIACEGDRVYVVWTDDRMGGTEVHATRSIDRGATWPADDVRLDEDVGAGEAIDPRIATGGGRAFVVWEDRRHGAPDVYVARTDDGGASWRETRLDTDPAGSANSLQPVVSAAGEAVYVVWEDHRHRKPDVFLSRSLDGGATWASDDLHLNSTLPGRSTSFRPRVAASGEHVFVTWYDDIEGRFDVLLTHSPDRGTTWLDPEVRFDTDEAGSQHSITPVVACQGARAHVVWQDERFGLGDIFYNSATFRR